MIFLNALFPWIVMVVLAILNGAIRQYFFLPKVGEQSAHVFGTIIFLILQFAVIHIYITTYCIYETALLLKTGFFWVGLTVLFEFVFGHYIMKHPWKRLIADYNIFNGRLWILVLINNVTAPLISGKLLQ